MVDKPGLPASTVVDNGGGGSSTLCSRRYALPLRDRIRRAQQCSARAGRAAATLTLRAWKAVGKARPCGGKATDEVALRVEEETAYMDGLVREHVSVLVPTTILKRCEKK